MFLPPGDKETMVTVPSIDSITGDKLTAFAPTTIGIPYFKGKDKQPFSMEICKQLFDLSKLFENIQKMKVVAAKILVNNLSPIPYYEGQDINDLTIEDQDFETDLLRELLRVFNKDAVKKATGDVFGRIYEYFLMKFSMQGAGAQEGGELNQH